MIVPGQGNSFCVYKGLGFQKQIFGIDLSAFFFSQITTHTHTLVGTCLLEKGNHCNGFAYKKEETKNRFSCCILLVWRRTSKGLSLK